MTQISSKITVLLLFCCIWSDIKKLSLGLFLALFMVKWIQGHNLHLKYFIILLLVYRGTVFVYLSNYVLIWLNVSLLFLVLSDQPLCMSSFQRWWTCCGPACWETIRGTGGESTRSVTRSSSHKHIDMWLWHDVVALNPVLI